MLLIGLIANTSWLKPRADSSMVYTQAFGVVQVAEVAVLAVKGQVRGVLRVWRYKT